MTRHAVAWMLVGLGALAGARDAEACGGCFAPPSAVQVVTDHRMVLSLAPSQTTLWDQIRYTGRPSDFSWILPIRNGPNVRIELADNNFVTTLDNLTAPVLSPPPPPLRRFCGARALAEDDTAAGGSPPMAARDAGVQVIQESVVGPYMTVTLRGEDPAALRAWLRDNNYSVPRATEPVIDHYVAMRMDFLALKLRPGEGVDRMQPVRITTPGYNPTLPLRMIAAGVADKVGLLLMVVAASRIEAMNFPNGELRDNDFTYDFRSPTQPAADFTAAFERLNRAQGNRVWLTESATVVNRFTVLNPLMRRGGAGMDDVRAAYDAIGENATVTRLRTDLAVLALDRDLTLAASDRGTRQRNYAYGRVLNRPPDDPPCGYVPPGTFQACAAAPGGGAHGSVTVLLGLGVALLTAGRRRRGRA